MRTHSYIHLDPTDAINGEAQSNETKPVPYPVLNVGDVALFPASIQQVRDLIVACNQAIGAVRDQTSRALADMTREQYQQDRAEEFLEDLAVAEAERAQRAVEPEVA